MLRRSGAVLVFALALAGCTDSNDGCTLACGTRSTTRADVPTVALTCGIQPVDCDLMLDDMGRVTSMECRYANAKFAMCTGVTYNGVSDIVGGTCTGEGQTCTLP